MTTAQRTGFLTQLRGIILAREADSLTDAQLLAGFLDHREEAAFAALVRRHGPMVLGVCRRVLQNLCDAEDAFQATFLVLARKAAALDRPQQVSNWLYGVAYRTALKARARRAMRHARQVPLMDSPLAEPDGDLVWNDLRPLLDEELHRLPEKYRTPLVLCYFEGKTKAQAAQLLGRPEGTVSTRLARGREMLRRRLTRRGLTLSVAALTAALSQGSASAVVPGVMIHSTARAAMSVAAGYVAIGAVSAPVAALTEGVLRAMLLAKVRNFIVTVVGMIFVAAVCAAGFLRAAKAGDDDAVRPIGFIQEEAKDKSDKEAPKDKPALSTHVVTEERVQKLAYKDKTPVDVRTDNGAVKVTSDPTLFGKNDVEGKIVAKITAAGTTDEEAKSRLAKVKITATQRGDTIVITAEFPDERRGNDACSFDVTAPSLTGVTVHSGNGAVHVEKATGPIKVHTKNGAITVTQVQGEVDLDSGNGAVTYDALDKAKGFKLKTANGAVVVHLPAGGEGSIEASTGNGAIAVRGAGADQSVTQSRHAKTVKLSPNGPNSTIRTGNGAITIELGK